MPQVIWKRDWASKIKRRWKQLRRKIRIANPSSRGSIELSYCVTVSVVVPATLPAEAAMVTLPTATGLTKPLLLMVAIELLLEVHDELVVTSPTVPSE